MNQHHQQQQHQQQQHQLMGPMSLPVSSYLDSNSFRFNSIELQQQQQQQNNNLINQYYINNGSIVQTNTNKHHNQHHSQQQQQMSSPLADPVLTQIQLSNTTTNTNNDNIAARTSSSLFDTFVKSHDSFLLKKVSNSFCI